MVILVFFFKSFATNWDLKITLLRYLLNDACVLTSKPLVSGSALRWEGQLTVYNFNGGPTYRYFFKILILTDYLIAFI